MKQVEWTYAFDAIRATFETRTSVIEAIEAFNQQHGGKSDYDPSDVLRVLVTMMSDLELRRKGLDFSDLG